MEPLLKNVFEEFHGRKFHDHCDIQKDFELAQSMNRDGKKKRYFFRPDGRVKTIEKETYLENYGNKLWHIHLNRVTFVLEDSEDKVSLKAYYYVKYRNEGKHYFITNKRVEFLTFNKKTKIVYVGTKYNKGNQSYVRSNSWNGMITDFFSRLSAGCKGFFTDGEGMFLNYSQVFFNKVFGYEIDITENGKFKPTDLFIKNYLTLHNVIIPNNYLAFFNNGESIKMSELKKSKFNLIDAVEKKYGLSGKKFHRVLHSVNTINPHLINFVKQLVSLKFIKSRPDNEILELFQYKDYFDVRNYTRLLNRHITDKERINIYTCLVDCVMNVGSMYTFMDHIKFYLTLKIRYNEDVTWESKTRNDFTVEHVEYSNKISRHKDGEWNRMYSQQFVDNVGKEIITPQGGVYYPVLFTKQKEYYGESECQSNCVKTYVKTTDCFIISLREGSSESKERATIEYRWNYPNLKFERRQSLGRFNKNLDTKWDYALEELDNQIKSAVKHFKFEEFKMTKTTQVDTIKYNVVKHPNGGYTLLQDGITDTNDNHDITNEEYLQNILMFDLDF
jgi:hypothetical protein